MRSQKLSQKKSRPYEMQNNEVLNKKTKYSHFQNENEVDSDSIREHYLSFESYCLDLSDRNIGDEGCKSICKGLMKNQDISLNLKNNNITFKSAPLFTEMLSTNKSLSFLNLSHNNLGDEGVELLIQGLLQNNNITSIDLSKCNISSKSNHLIASLLKHNKRITWINLGDNNLGDVKDFKSILEALNKNPRITFFNISNKNMRLLSEISLCLKRNLSYDVGAYNDTYKRVFVFLLCMNASKTKFPLSLLYTLIYDFIVLDRRSSFKEKDRELNPKPTSVNKCTPKNFKLFSESVEKYDPNKIKEIANKVENNDPSLKPYLDLSYRNIGDDGAKSICKALMKNMVITSFNFKKNNLTSKNALLFLMMLSTNKSLSSLNLSYNNLGDEGVGPIIHALFQNNNITSIDLSKCKITHKSIGLITYLLQVNKKITSMNLSYNNLGDEESYKTILKALGQNLTITSFKIYNKKTELLGVEEQISHYLRRNADHYMNKLKFNR